MLVSLNGEILTNDTATISPFHSGTYYGTGCFETIRAESGNLLFFEEHYKRLAAGLAYLGVKDTDVPQKQTLSESTKQLLRHNSVSDGTAKIRIQCTLAEDDGYNSDDNARLFTMITTKKYHPAEEPKVLSVAKTTVIPRSSRPNDLKLSNMLHYRQAFREAQSNGTDDAVLLTIEGYVSETSIANLLWKKGDSFYTPSKDCDLLPGITLRKLTQSLRNVNGFVLKQGKFNLHHLMSADSVWVINSLLEVHPVKRINQKEYKVDSELTRNLLQIYYSS